VASVNGVVSFRSVIVSFAYPWCFFFFQAEDGIRVHPSFVPVNPRSFRSTSSNLSIGWASTFFAWPLTVNETSHFALAAGKRLMPSLVPRPKQIALRIQGAELRRDLREAAEWKRSERQLHLPRR